ncbi:MAG: hypothetical protein KC466_13240 [Myxococcales bacterium]|nr:hypothetical protein [Myxococcales bacterium]
MTRKRANGSQQLQLFEPQAGIDLQRYFQRKLAMDLEVAFNPCEHRVHLRRSGARARLEMHPVFQEARAVHLDAVANLVRGRDPVSREIVGAFLRQKEHAIRSRYPRARRITLYPYGKNYNLLDIYARINRRYFGDEVRAYITWGKRVDTRRKRWSIRFGSFDRSVDLIRVHPLLDSTAVPVYFVEYIVYHEMLHAVVPEQIRAGRRIVHTPEFGRREREFAHYTKALAWERAHTRTLLRSAVPT